MDKVYPRYHQPPAFSSYANRITDDPFLHNPSVCMCNTYVKFIKSICELALESTGEKSFMVSFEFSVIDIILMIAVIALLALYLTKPSTETNDKLEHFNREKKTPETSTVSVETKRSSEEALPTKDIEMENPTKCTHRIGFLRDLPKNASIPNECFTCPKYITCALGDK